MEKLFNIANYTLSHPRIFFSRNPKYCLSASTWPALLNIVNIAETWHKLAGLDSFEGTWKITFSSLDLVKLISRQTDNHDHVNHQSCILDHVKPLKSLVIFRKSLLEGLALLFNRFPSAGNVLGTADQRQTTPCTLSSHWPPKISVNAVSDFFSTISNIRPKWTLPVHQESLINNSSQKGKEDHAMYRMAFKALMENAEKIWY